MVSRASARIVFRVPSRLSRAGGRRSDPACAWERVRANARAMLVVGLSTMLGAFVHDLWLANAASVSAALAAFAAVAAMAGLSLGLAPLLDRRFAPQRPHAANLDRSEART